MDNNREKILIEGGLESACNKAGKMFIQGEFITCEKFRELFISSVKLPDIELINCPSMKYVETDFGKDHRFIFLIDLFTGALYYYRCSFNVTVPGGKHSGSGCYINDVGVEKWKWDWAVDFNPDEFYLGDDLNNTLL
ncbi:MAG: hypothetical protein Q8P34_14240 [Bacteroidota bacterium]|nr:hypothetical protein [Bacteroidota bacterium]